MLMTNLGDCRLNAARDFCRSELAREGLQSNAFIQEERVIVNALREQARSYRRSCQTDAGNG
ncbi:hypothetical protein EMIT0P253_60216 [Pseudomonas sp. IT-P253]